jgi:hypothetical protein
MYIEWTVLYSMALDVRIIGRPFFMPAGKRVLFSDILLPVLEHIGDCTLYTCAHNE